MQAKVQLNITNLNSKVAKRCYRENACSNKLLPISTGSINGGQGAASENVQILKRAKAFPLIF